MNKSCGRLSSPGVDCVKSDALYKYTEFSYYNMIVDNL